MEAEAASELREKVRRGDVMIRDRNHIDEELILEIDLDHAWDHFEGLVEELGSIVDLNKEEKLFHHLEETAHALGFPAYSLNELGKIK